MYVVADDRLARICVAILDRPIVLSVAERIAADELGCMTCGGCFPKADQKGKFPGRCPHCGFDLRDNGYLGGSTVVPLRNSSRRSSDRVGSADIGKR